MAGMQRITLGQRRAEAAELDRQIREHSRDCRACRPRKPCEDKRWMAAELRAVRRDIARWFEPGPDQAPLF